MSAPAIDATTLATGVWEIDPSHSSVGFVARHLMFTKVRGTFGKLTARINVGDSIDSSSVQATIDATSLDSGDARRDGHLRGADFFDVERYPELSFRSTHLAPKGGNRFTLTGDLTIRDVTKPVDLDVEFLGLLDTPWGHKVAAFSASAEIDRETWGLTWNVAIESGGVLVGKKVTLEIEAQFKLAAAEKSEAA